MTDIFDDKQPSIVILNSGEKLITVLQEAYQTEGEEKKGVCLVLNHPYELSLTSVTGSVEEQDIQVKFSRWVPYSIDTQFRIPYSSVISFGVPDPGLSEAYILKVRQAQSVYDNQQKSLNQQMQEEEIQKVLETQVVE